MPLRRLRNHFHDFRMFELRLVVFFQSARGEQLFPRQQTELSHLLLVRRKPAGGLVHLHPSFNSRT